MTAHKAKIAGKQVSASMRDTANSIMNDFFVMANFDSVDKNIRMEADGVICSNRSQKVELKKKSSDDTPVKKGLKSVIEGQFGLRYLDTI